MPGEGRVPPAGWCWRGATLPAVPGGTALLCKPRTLISPPGDKRIGLLQELLYRDSHKQHPTLAIDTRNPKPWKCLRRQSISAEHFRTGRILLSTGPSKSFPHFVLALPCPPACLHQGELQTRLRRKDGSSFGLWSWASCCLPLLFALLSSPPGHPRAVASWPLGSPCCSPAALRAQQCPWEPGTGARPWPGTWTRVSPALCTAPCLFFSPLGAFSLH